MNLINRQINRNILLNKHSIMKLEKSINNLNNLLKINNKSKIK